MGTDCACHRNGIRRHVLFVWPADTAKVPPGMNLFNRSLMNGAFWTLVSFTLGQGLRVFTTVVLARLLAPELFGIMILVNSLRTGIDLVSDVGVGQNIITNPMGDDKSYYQTAWTLQAIRGVLLWIVSCLAAWPLASMYHAPILMTLLPIAGLYFVLQGFTSVSLFLAQKRFMLRRVNAFELAMDVLSSACHVGLALITQTVWALVFGGLLYVAGRMVASYYLLPDVNSRFQLSKTFALQILSFGKWIFLSSIVYYFAMSSDRLYLAKVAPLGLLGVYGIARNFSDLITSLVVRLSAFVIVPLIASSFDMPRDSLKANLAPIRLRFLLLAAAGLGTFSALADLPIGILYDHRYQSAGWMISVLAIGAWIAILCSINESTLLGLRQPLYGAAANSLKLVWLLAGLPVSYSLFGILGVITVVALSDLGRYGPILFGQFRERLSFLTQDLVATLLLLGVMGLLEWLRWSLNWGTSFDGLSAMLAHPA